MEHIVQVETQWQVVQEEVVVLQVVPLKFLEPQVTHLQQVQLKEVLVVMLIELLMVQVFIKCLQEEEEVLLRWAQMVVPILIQDKVVLVEQELHQVLLEVP